MRYERRNFFESLFMRVCFWSTTFQADCLALAHYLAAQPDCEVWIACDQPERAAASAHGAPPLRARFVDRNERTTAALLRRQAFDVMIIDNHLPSAPIAERTFVLWHGFGWRHDDLKTMRRELAQLVGPVTAPNPRFRWQAVGDWDRSYRIQHSQLHPDNVVALGSPYSDWLLPTAATGDAARPTLERAKQTKTVLLALTWHHGGALEHWGDEQRLLEQLVDHVQARGGRTILRMHDRRRYRGDVIRKVEQLAQRCGETLALKWKDTSPDSLGDLLGSDVCISNYSSILNGYYFTQKPSIHIDPHDASATQQRTYKMFLGRPFARRVQRPDQLWKLDPDQHGGLRARSFDELLAHIDTALGAPDCCAERSRSFIERYVRQADGSSCARTASFLRRWLHVPEPAVVAPDTSRPQQEWT